MVEIPRELITEVLLCSSVKSVMRFRCLSKSLCAIIDGDDFVNWHRSRCSENMIHRKLIFQDRSSRFHVCNMNDNTEEDGHLKSFASLNDQVYGYCNGLLLLYRSYKFTLWNPSTRQYKNLPDFRSFRVGIHLVIMSGLGYDSNDGYKAVVMLYQPSLVEVELWSFRVRSNTWTRIQCFPYPPEIFQFRTGMFADGRLYWLSLKSPQKIRIRAFDLRNETFSSAPLPVCSSDNVLTDLHVLEDCVCISCFYPRPPAKADLFMRNKDGVNWTKIYSINKPEILKTFGFRRVKVLGYLKNRDTILLDFSMEDVFSYDLKKKSLEKVAIKRSPLWDHPILCAESLVSI